MSELMNLNTASLDELVSLPGIGPAIAKRIVADRPFDELEDLQTVEGIGPAFIERISSLVTLELDVLTPEVEPPEETEPALEEQSVLDGDSGEVGEAIPEDGLSPEEESVEPDPEVVEPLEPPKAKTVTRGQAWAMSIFSSFIAFLLALIISLGILGGINGGLRFVRPGQLFELGRRVEILDEQVHVLSQEIDDLRERLSHFDAIGERVDQLDEDFSIALEQTEFLVDEMNELRSYATEFQYFLDGLRELLSAIQQTESP
ncbi:MAG: helix-hairpin-helix domain-containing protein [Anaerolineales bacterium]|nr:helix-hairpin-helix domain-containing protein [Chloroflexota bacterium]MBL6981026.1 helix-hairpin-helix domain-containing protein [Anaerolineales bacterium]